METLKATDRMLNSVGVGIQRVAADSLGDIKYMHLPHVPADPDYVRKSDAANAVAVGASTQIPITSDDVSKLEDSAWLTNLHKFNVWVSNNIVARFPNPAERKEWLLRHYPEYFELQTKAVAELNRLSAKFNKIQAIGPKSLEDLYFMYDYEINSLSWQNTIGNMFQETLGVVDSKGPVAAKLRDDSGYSFGFYNPRANLKRGYGVALAQMRTNTWQPTPNENMYPIRRDDSYYTTGGIRNPAYLGNFRGVTNPGRSVVNYKLFQDSRDWLGMPRAWVPEPGTPEQIAAAQAQASAERAQATAAAQAQV